MSITSITTTCCDPFFCVNPDCGNSYLRKRSKCSVCLVNEDILESSSLQALMREEFLPEDSEFVEDPSRINFFNIDINPSTSTFCTDDQYGEPLTNAQELTIDFTPVKGVDDDKVLIKKCLDFWNFIEKNPMMNKFCAMPEPSGSYSSAVVEEETESKDSDEKSLQKDQALYWINNENIVNDTFVTKALKPTPCELRQDYSISHESTAQRRDKAKDVNSVRRSDSTVSKRSGKSKQDRINTQLRASSPLEVHKLCKQMEEWDLTHPKSMLPPSPPPRLSHAVMQRKP